MPSIWPGGSDVLDGPVRRRDGERLRDLTQERAALVEHVDRDRVGSDFLRGAGADDGPEPFAVVSHPVLAPAVDRGGAGRAVLRDADHHRAALRQTVAGRYHRLRLRRGGGGGCVGRRGRRCVGRCVGRCGRGRTGGRVSARRRRRHGGRIGCRGAADDAAAGERGGAGEREEYEARESKGTARHPLSIGDAAATDVNDLSVAAGTRPRVRGRGR